MAGVLHLWNEWGIQILVLLSFMLQVLLLSFAWMRRRSISSALRILLWFMYLLAEYTATYALGHMSITTSCKPAGKQQQQQQLLKAFWAPFLLVHLGGQDTITAYAMEDNQLWLRHLLAFAVQALGAAYVLYKNMGSPGPLVAPAVLIYLVGVLKNAERVWALSFSRLEIIRRYLDGVSIKKNHELVDMGWDGESVLVEMGWDGESVMQGAHDLLYICMGQFVDDRIYPSVFQNSVMKHFHVNSKTFELVEMQLSLMYDIFYTKAAVIHTWYGRCVRVMSLLATVMAFSLFQFQFSTDGKDYGYSTVDAAVTYILAVGALILEIASVLRAMGSTWTCATLKAIKWDWLHNLHVSLRRCVRIVEARRWSSSIGQLNLQDSYCDETSLGLGGITLSPQKDKRGLIDKVRSLGSKMVSFCTDGSRRRGFTMQIKDKVTSLGSKMVVSFCTDGSSMIYSPAAKELVLEEIQRMVKACQGDEGVMRSYRGQCALERPDKCIKPDHSCSWSFPDGILKDLTKWSMDKEFDESILAWHLATDEFLTEYSESADAKPLTEATKAVSNYMMFLFVERPYMLPSPVRPTLHLQARKALRGWRRDSWFNAWKENKKNEEKKEKQKIKVTPQKEVPQVLNPGAELAEKLQIKQKSLERPGPNMVNQHDTLIEKDLYKARPSRSSVKGHHEQDSHNNIAEVLADPGAELAEKLQSKQNSLETPQPKLELLRVVFGVWMEMLCYAAHHCSRESHARQLSSGGELITAVWLLTMAEFDRVYYSPENFKERKHGSVWNFLNFVDFKDFVESMKSHRPHDHSTCSQVRHRRYIVRHR